jgi:cell wall assembly regulator SMI1
MKNIDEIILELQKFTDKIVTFKDPASLSEIVAFEKSIEIKLPEDYKRFLQFSNGFDLRGKQVYGINPLDAENLESIYLREHYEVEIPQYKHLVPFSPDGAGNFYCFDTSKTTETGLCEVIFWTSNYEYTDDDEPEVPNDSFIDWMQEVVIDWTLEDYDYDGTAR